MRWVDTFLNNKRKRDKKNMQDFVNSLIRTYVPLIVGAVAAWAVTLGLEIDANTQTSLIVVLTAALQGAYYLIIRLIERKFPKVGVLLGKASAPEYTK